MNSKILTSSKVIKLLVHLTFQNNFDSGVFSTDEGAPLPATEVTAIPLSPESLEVTWLSSDEPGGPPVSYEIHYSLDGFVLQMHDDNLKR